MAEPPVVKVIATGGTISSLPEAPGAGLAAALAGRDLVGQSSHLMPSVRLEVEEFSRVLSSQLTVDQVFSLARRIRTTLQTEPVDAVVVTHGTGVMEETAFVTDVLLDDERPVVFTGAMRPAGDPQGDGPRNLADAVRLAVAPAARGLGVLVAMNGQVHAARTVTKGHTSALETFRSPGWGPLGFVDPDGTVGIGRLPRRRCHLSADAIEPNVDLVTFCVGMDDRYIRASLAAGARGIVIAGSGLGNVNAAVEASVRAALAGGVTVVIVSRCPEGRVYPAYAGSHELATEGVIFSSLSGPKARWLLMLALGAGAGAGAHPGPDADAAGRQGPAPAAAEVFAQFE